MEYCQNCGNLIAKNSKFCSNCGLKIDRVIENKIDKSIESISKNVNSVRKEIIESEYVSIVKENSIEAFSKIKNFIVAFLGYLGLIIVFVQLFNYIIIGNQLLIVESYNFFFRDGSSYISLSNKLSSFIPEALITTIFPLFFMFYYGKKKRWMSFFAIIFICVIILAFLLSDNKGNEELSLFY